MQAVQEDMVRRKIGVTTSIKQAEELIDNNQTDRKEDGAQQIQKLRFNVSDLKIRFNAVCSPYIVSFVKIDKENSLNY